MSEDYSYISDPGQDDEDQMEIEIIDDPSYSDEDSEDNPINRQGNRAQDEEEAKRRIAERNLLRDNSLNFRAITDLDSITQRLGVETAERFRALIENRRAQTISLRTTTKADINWLRKYLPEKELEHLDESQLAYIKTIIGWFGASAGILLIRLNMTKLKKMHVNFKA
eukprot:CAMPEP_0168340832 /NCGR_PEP_ID=MMETSP0213-20121227/14302_1 /TAXON_ID=151035 /ORGANISM="Euplotes harpa, Strain FSP1.4" /LENGTH=167 /DNA_ID=CAMNT_0008347151 /DNA_START=9 /DNA_END=512 /DNA_ORIENTATION=-